MEKNWEEITSDLYSKINPISGSIVTRIDEQYIRLGILYDLRIEFEMNDFIYFDPFYGEQKSTDPFKMNIGLERCVEKLEIEYIHSLENVIIEDLLDNPLGAFSNGLSFKVTKIEFGKIKESKIYFKMEYHFVNFDGDEEIDKTLKNVTKAKGKIEIPLEIKDMLVLMRKGNNPKRVLQSLNPEFYDINTFRVPDDIQDTYRDYELFEIGYNNLNR